jgi:hypothetical protein
VYKIYSQKPEYKDSPFYQIVCGDIVEAIVQANNALEDLRAVDDGNQGVVIGLLQSSRAAKEAIRISTDEFRGYAKEGFVSEADMHLLTDYLQMKRSKVHQTTLKLCIQSAMKNNSAGGHTVQVHHQSSRVRGGMVKRAARRFSLPTRLDQKTVLKKAAKQTELAMSPTMNTDATII